VYAPDSYRFTPWCRAECEFSLAPERQVGVRRVIIFTTGAGSGAEKLGQEFATAPRFNLSKKGCFKDAVKLIKRSRAFLYQNSSTPNDLERL